VKNNARHRQKKIISAIAACSEFIYSISQAVPGGYVLVHLDKVPA